MRIFMMIERAMEVFTLGILYRIFLSVGGLIAFNITRWSLFEWRCHNKN